MENKKGNGLVVFLIIIVLALTISLTLLLTGIVKSPFIEEKKCEIKETKCDTKETVVTNEEVKVLTEDEIKNTNESDILAIYEYENPNPSTGRDLKKLTLTLYKNNVMEIHSGNGSMGFDSFRGVYKKENNIITITRIYYSFSSNGTIEWIDGERQMINQEIPKTDSFEMGDSDSELTSSNYLKGFMVNENGYDVKLTKK